MVPNDPARPRPAGPCPAVPADAIASWGANSVRLPLNQDCWTATNGAAADYSGAKYIDAVKDFAQQLNDAGLVVLLDLHATKAPGDPDSGAEMRAMPDAGAVQFWESVAATFADNPAVMFDAYNEPYGIWNDTTGGWQFELSWECWRDGGCDVPVEEADAASFSGDTYPAVGMTQLVETIRGAGAQQPIMHQARRSDRRSERDFRVEQRCAADRRRAAGQRPAELDGVVAAGRAARGLLPAAAGRAAEREGDRPTVPGQPLGHHVRDDRPVVVGGQDGVPAGGPAEVDPMHPRVASEDHVHEVAEGPALGRSR